MGFRGRLEAIRAPTRGKARKGMTTKSTALSPPVPQLGGGCTARVATYNTMLAAHRRSERPCQPGGRVGAHPTETSTVFACPFRHNPTLQDYRLQSVTTIVTTIVF
jgi:hypothetical protein